MQNFVKIFLKFDNILKGKFQQGSGPRWPARATGRRRARASAPRSPSRRPFWRKPLRQSGFRSRHSHSFRGSFSAGSSPIFASRYAFFSTFQDITENQLLASKFANKFANFIRILQNFCIFLKITQKIIIF